LRKGVLGARNDNALDTTNATTKRRGQGACEKIIKMRNLALAFIPHVP
jgi:hypothetical protein